MGLFWSRDSGFSGLGYVSNPWGVGNEIGGDWTGMIWIKVGTGRRKSGKVG